MENGEVFLGRTTSRILRHVSLSAMHIATDVTVANVDRDKDVFLRAVQVFGRCRLIFFFLVLM